MELPLRCLFTDPTIAGLAQHIGYDVSLHTYRYMSEVPQWTCLVPAQPKGTRTPLFFVGGYQNPDDTLQVLWRFIPHLDLDQPVFGLRPRWAEGTGEGYDSVNEMVVEFLAELRTIQSKGPYLLGGHCVGGVVALEIARQLMLEGEEVKLLALLDTERPTKRRALLADIRLKQRRAMRMGEQISEILKPMGRSRGEVIQDLVHRKLGKTSAAHSANPATKRFEELKIEYRRLAYSHSLARYPGRITLFVNQEQFRYDPDLGWKGVAEGGLNVHELPGDHHTVLTLHGRDFAKNLGRCIDEVQLGPGHQADRIQIGAS
jgi:thioesterase domain-containing protein